jgi:Holliday junction resolvase
VSRNRARGTAAETAVVDYLRTQGWPHAERRAMGGAKDRGDIAGLVGVVLEVKAAARVELAAWVDETKTETANDHARYGLCWFRRKSKGSPADWFVVMDGATAVRLLRDALGVEVDRG